MNKSIYEEAIKHLNILNNFVIMWCDEIDLDYHDTYKNNYQKVKKAIEQAQKKEKLLELYIKIYNGITDYHDYDELSELQKEIKELENE